MQKEFFGSDIDYQKLVDIKYDFLALDPEGC